MKLKKEKVDKVIRITKEYFRTGDIDILPELSNAEIELRRSGETTWDVVHLIEDLAKFTHYTDKGSYEDIYRVLAIYDVIVE